MLQNCYKVNKRTYEKTGAIRMKIEKWTPPIILILIALIFTILGFYLPWWSIKMAPESEMALNGTARADYGLLQVVTASRTIRNDTQLTAVPIANLTKSQEDLNAIASVFNSTFALVVAGLVLSLASLVLVIISIRGKPMRRLATLATLLAAFLLFIAPLYITSTLPTVAPKLTSLIPSTLVPNNPPFWLNQTLLVKPKDITGFWGSIKIPSSSEFPAWVRDGNFWMWGPASGWLLTFTASLLLFVATTLINQIFVKE